MKRNNILQSLLYIIQGAIVGVGAILPGVSGGVLCVAFGIYEPMMELLTHPRVAIKKSYRMFIPFLIGWVLGFLLLARGIEILFAAASEIALMLFFGLICGTMPQLFKDSERGDPKIGWTPFIISLSAAYLFFHILEGGVAMTVAPGSLSFLLCGILWGLSLIVPGLSSSSILIYLGLYEPMTSGIAALDLGVLIPMGIGIVATALSLARLVNMLFKKHYAVTSRAVLGFVVASSLKAIPTEFPSTASLIISLICFAVGFAVAYIMDKAESKHKTTSSEEKI
jgi:putative membrane protein